MAHDNEARRRAAGSDEDADALGRQYGSLISTLPVRDDGPFPMVFYRGFWFRARAVPNIMALNDLFTARRDDVYVVTQPKCGTTWLKALVFAVATRSRHPFTEDHPLLHVNPHKCVPYLEVELWRNKLISDLEALPSPRLLSSHIPFSLLPSAITDLGCRMVYVCRDPKDVFVSRWHFDKEITNTESGGNATKFSDVNDAFELFVQGVVPYGPAWDHYLEFWKMSLASPERVLFLRYEEMKRDVSAVVRRLAEFMGCPFTGEEEEAGAVEKVVELCSFEKMTALEVNRSGTFKVGEGMAQKNSVLFRDAKVGGWSSLITEDMARRLDAVVEEKLSGSGLTFGGVF